MERGVFGILLLSGLCHFASSLHHRQYHLISKPKTWFEAQRYCRESYTDLATVTDVQNLVELAGLINSKVHFVFLGLYRGWGWSLSDTDDYKEGEQPYWNWAIGEPTKHFCGSIQSNGQWFAKNCNSSLKFLCYDSSTTDVSQRFVLGKGSMDWFAAQAYCRKQHTDLARVRNQLENEELQRKKYGPVWIGLTGNSWMWSDGSEPTFKPWKPYEPLFSGINDCGMLEVHSNPLGMVDRSCTEKWPFICYSAPKRKHLVRMQLTTIGSSVDMTDPAVKESILKGVERKLKDKDVKLSWRKLPEKEETSREGKTHMKCVP